MELLNKKFLKSICMSFVQVTSVLMRFCENNSMKIKKKKKNYLFLSDPVKNPQISAFSIVEKFLKIVLFKLFLR